MSRYSQNTFDFYAATQKNIPSAHIIILFFSFAERKKKEARIGIKREI